ncbi:MAG: class I SAM-dependent methyltransferase [Polyangiaceae bacterium]|nr:class I SAM-dependent methyltransferase [Polyangiaceae bacterium]
MAEERNGAAPSSERPQPDPQPGTAARTSSPSRAAGVEPPSIRSPEWNREFRERARAYSWDPDDRFVDGYVEWEWQRSRHLFDGLFTSVEGKRALEFGCHLGGTSILLAALGAEVTAIDIEPQLVELTELNVKRYGYADRIRALLVPDTTQLPFEGASFDLVSCNSVLEYVPPEILPAVLHELDRVLVPGGVVFIASTSNRVWPKEMHSQRWLVNYIPHALRPLVVQKRVESVSPWRLGAGFPGYKDLMLEDGGQRMAEFKKRSGLGGPALKAIEVAGRALAPLGIHPGFVMPTITMVLRKPER